MILTTKIKDHMDDDADDDVMIVGMMVISIRRRWRLKSSS